MKANLKVALLLLLPKAFNGLEILLVIFGVYKPVSYDSVLRTGNSVGFKVSHHLTGVGSVRQMNSTCDHAYLPKGILQRNEGEQGKLSRYGCT